MVKKTSLSDVKRAQVVTLYGEGYSERSISERVKCSKNAVHNAIVKFRKTGSYSDAKRSCQPRQTTPQDDDVIRRAAVWSPMTSASKVRAVLLAKGADVSRRTVSRPLVNDFSLKSRKPAEKNRLTPAMKAKRLVFAQKHVNWTIQQWHPTVALDAFFGQIF